MESMTYSVAEAGELIGVSRSKMYEFIKKEYESGKSEFRIIKVGSQYRIPKKSFEKWLNAE